jgi:hypothetical protein
MLIGITGDVETNPGCAGKGRLRKQNNSGDGRRERKTENPKGSHKSGERMTTGIWW